MSIFELFPFFMLGFVVGWVADDIICGIKRHFNKHKKSEP